jgi:cation:H+ antiporter
MGLLLLQLAGLAGLILYCGRNLAFLGDMIALSTGLGRAWIGIILLATVTSLPELSAGVSSVWNLHAPDLAVGNVIGSCGYNLLILSLLDLFNRKKPLFSIASGGHVLAAGLTIILLAMIGLALYLPEDIVIMNWIGISSISFSVVYFVSVRIIFLNEQRQSIVPETDPSKEKVNLKRTALLFSLNAAVVVVAALALPEIAAALAEKLSLNQSMAGILLVAAVTTLPEATVSISAIRKGAVDLAVGNLLGSNLFNITILSIDDIFYRDGILLKDAGDNHILSVFLLIMMCAVAVIGLAYRSNQKILLMAWDCLIIAVLFIANLLLLYYLG